MAIFRPFLGFSAKYLLSILKESVDWTKWPRDFKIDIRGLYVIIILTFKSFLVFWKLLPVLRQSKMATVIVLISTQKHVHTCSAVHTRLMYLAHVWLAGLSLSFGPYFPLLSPTFLSLSLSLSKSEKSQISLNFHCLIDLRLDIKPVSADLIKLLFVW